MSTVITSVDAGSPAERAGIRAGEQLLMINHHEIVDVLDYRFFCYDPSVSLRLREADGTTRHLTIEKEEGEDLGLNFDTYLMDEPRPSRTTACSALSIRCRRICATRSISRTMTRA